MAKLIDKEYLDWIDDEEPIEPDRWSNPELFREEEKEEQTSGKIYPAGELDGFIFAPDDLIGNVEFEREPDVRKVETKVSLEKNKNEYEDEDKPKGKKTSYIKSPYYLLLNKSFNPAKVIVLSILVYKWSSQTKSGGFVKAYNGELMNLASISEPTLIKYLKELEKEKYIQSLLKGNKKSKGSWKGYKINKSKCSEYFDIN